MKIIVLKRTGKTEAFDENKIIKVVQAAGLNLKQAEKLSDSLKSWVKTQKEKSIPSLKIRDKVLQELKKIKPHAYSMYQQYQRSKESTHHS